jgi:hypothetical protein
MKTETFGSICQITWLHIPEYCNLQTRRLDSLKISDVFSFAYSQQADYTEHHYSVWLQTDKHCPAWGYPLSKDSSAALK